MDGSTEKDRDAPTLPPPALWPLFLGFLKIGSTAFGGFMALISVIQTEIVERKKLLRHDDMLDLVSLATILPGPVAVNVVAAIGYRLRGGWGALVCAFGVLLPAFVFMVAFTIAYFKWGQLPAVSRVFQGFMPAIAAIVAATAWRMGRKTIVKRSQAFIAVVAFAVLLALGGFVATVGLIVAAGILGGWLYQKPAVAAVPPATTPTAPPAARSGRRFFSSDGGLGVFALVSLLGPQSVSAFTLFATFAGLSVFLFGGGFVFIPLIQEVVVAEQGWVTRQEFVDAIAIGQVTPGPILISAAFIGYKVLGLFGAVVATIGIYLPPALLMLAGTRFFDFLKASPSITAALMGIRAAVIGMLAAAAVVIAATAPLHWLSLAIFVAALIALLRFRADVVWVIPPAGIVGFILY